MPRPLSTLVSRLREERSLKLITEATALFQHATTLHETAGTSGRQRRAAHLIAARAERLTARSYLWSPAPPADPATYTGP